MSIICINRDIFLHIADHRIIRFIWFSLIPMPFLSFPFYIYNLPLFIEFILLFFICLWHLFSLSFFLSSILPPAHFCLFIFFNIDYTDRQLKKYVPSDNTIEAKQICTYSSLLPPSFLLLFFLSIEKEYIAMDVMIYTRHSIYFSKIDITSIYWHRMELKISRKINEKIAFFL